MLSCEHFASWHFVEWVMEAHTCRLAFFTVQWGMLALVHHHCHCKQLVLLQDFKLQNLQRPCWLDNSGTANLPAIF
jgi:hypothetical protein